MADLDPLIRYRKHGVDEKRRALAALYEQAEELARQKQAILDEIEKEKQLAKEAGDVESAAFLGRYLEGAKKKIKGFDKALREMETKIAVAQEDMRNAFAEMKKVEITQRNRDKREKAAQQKKEDMELDEIALDQYRRRLEEEE